MSSCPPGINEEALLDSAQKYAVFKKERVEGGFTVPVGDGVLMWDEVKVYIRTCISYTCHTKLVWHVYDIHVRIYTFLLTQV